jgi:hypothetical protein
MPKIGTPSRVAEVTEPSKVQLKIVELPMGTTDWAEEKTGIRVAAGGVSMTGLLPPPPPPPQAVRKRVSTRTPRPSLGACFNPHFIENL